MHITTVLDLNQFFTFCSINTHTFENIYLFKYFSAIVLQ